MLDKIRHHDHQRGIRIECYTDGYIYNEFDEFYLLSVVGFDSAVKGISAAAVSFREIEILTETPITLYASRNEKYRILTAKLASGLLHQIVACEGFFTEEGDTKIIHVPEGVNIPQAIYRKIRQGYTIPAIPEWAGWLHHKTIENEMLKELRGNIKAYELSTHEKQLDDLISEGIKNKEIIIEGGKEDAATDQQHNGIPQNLWNRTC